MVCFFYQITLDTTKGGYIRYNYGEFKVLDYPSEQSIKDLACGLAGDWPGKPKTLPLTTTTTTTTSSSTTASETEPEPEVDVQNWRPTSQENVQSKTVNIDWEIGQCFITLLEHRSTNCFLQKELYVFIILLNAEHCYLILLGTVWANATGFYNSRIEFYALFDTHFTWVCI